MGHQQLSKRLSAQRERAQVQLAGSMSCLQDQAAAEAPARLAVLMRLSVCLLSETPGNGRVRQRGESTEPHRGLPSSGSIAHLSTAGAKDTAFPPLSVVLQLLSTTRNDCTSVRGPPGPAEPPQKKLLSTAPEFADAAAEQQRCSPSSREQQDSPSRSRRARPSRATRGTLFRSAVKCARRRRRTAACSARCDEVIR